MPAHHKTSETGTSNKSAPHAGPVGERSFEYYFASPQDFQEAMAKARDLESKGMYRRAWRIRLNLDGVQPKIIPPRPDAPPAELTEKEKKELRRKKKRLNELRLKADKLAEELKEHGHE